MSWSANKGANKDYGQLIDGCVCGQLETLQHRLLLCPSLTSIYTGLKDISMKMIEQNLSDDRIRCLSFNHRNKHRLQVTLWFVIKVLFEIYTGEELGRIRTWQGILKEIEWGVRNGGVIIGSLVEMHRLEVLLKRDLHNLIN